MHGSVKVALLIITWYGISSINNVVGKSLLNQFPFPMTLTFVQLLSISIYSGFLSQGRRTEKSAALQPFYYKLIVPLAIGKFLSSVSSHFSIWLVPVSYAHTVKATMPLFTVLLARVLLKEVQSTSIYLSLVPIIAGVTIATMTEFNFDVMGLIAALIATCGFSLQNIFSKKLMKDTGVHHIALLALLARLALFIFTPIWIIFEGWTLLFKMGSFNIEAYGLLWLDGMLNFLQNIFAFTILSLVTPLTYAVANATKRIAIIGVSLFIMRNPVSGTNVFGMFVAILGVFLYNRAKFLEKKMKLLPTTTKDDLNFNRISMNAVV